MPLFRKLSLAPIYDLDVDTATKDRLVNEYKVWYSLLSQEIIHRVLLAITSAIFAWTVLSALAGASPTDLLPLLILCFLVWRGMRGNRSLRFQVISLIYTRLQVDRGFREDFDTLRQIDRAMGEQVNALFKEVRDAKPPR